MNFLSHRTSRLVVSCAALLAPAAFLMTGCGREPERQSFSESVPPPATETPALPAGHPPIGSSDMSSSMLPAGHPPLTSMTNAGAGGAMDMPPMQGDPHRAPAALEWTAPAGWTEQPGQGMRRATFFATNAQGAAECSVITLTGAAGGVASNVQRWAGQVGAPFGPEQLKAFVDGLKEEKTAAGQPVWIVDFTTLPAPAGAPADAPSMIAAIVNRDSDTVFLKLTAARAVLELERGRLRELALSVK